MKQIFDKNLWCKHRDFAAHNIGDSDFIIKYAVEDIASSTALLGTKCWNILDIGCRFGWLSSNLSEIYPEAKITATEISKEMISQNHVIKNVINIDDEEIDFPPESFDLIVSCMNLHWMNDIRGFLSNVRSLLSKGGYCIMNFVASGSLDHLKHYLVECESKDGRGHAPHIIPLIQEDKVYLLFQEQHFDFITVTSNKIELEYDTPLALMKDLESMGENSCLKQPVRPLPPSLFNYDLSQPFKDVLNLVTVVASQKKLLNEYECHAPLVSKTN